MSLKTVKKLREEIAIRNKKLQESQILYEGLIYSHDINATMKMLTRYTSDFTMSHKDSNNLFALLVRKKMDFESYKKTLDALIRLANNLGWFVMKSRLFVNSSFKFAEYKNSDVFFKNLLKNKDEQIELCVLYFEAKYDLEQPLENYYYHSTSFKYIKKIKKYGLVPKSKNKTTSHPERIYLTKTYDDAKDIGGMMSKWNDSDFIILKIKSEAIPGLKIFNDPNFEGGVYTYNNIGPEAITNLNDIIS
jgi:hypothetical protein